ncbi:4-hydroxy-3-methylbut-2-enyl diphosphate reductase [Actinoplanes sp. NPDC026670]|uniref:4-hydroxy-3-methylbut-2-enyl diphosphate reductase n=1 Tax=Actinoplanes sp. NPDC026670 TaxID=3154700 RepID=UPI0033F85C64
MEVLLAAPRSFCAGVERAVDMVENALRVHGPPIWVRRQIVHNAHVVTRLEALGAIFVDELDQIPDGATVVFSAHGVAPAVRAEAARRGLHVIDATCPLVAKVHAEARRFAARGDTVLLIGHDGHDEVEGTLGQIPGIRLVGDVADAATVEVDDPRRVAYLTQTTLAAGETAAIVGTLRDRFPGLAGPAAGDICYATTNRQEAVAAIAAASDVVLVVGSANSSNSQRLVEVARRHGTPAHLIEDAGEIRSEWVDGVRTVGLTAGASAPPHLVAEVIAALGPDTVTEHRVTDENVTFVLPPALRDPGSPGYRPGTHPGAAPGLRERQSFR